MWLVVSFLGLSLYKVKVSERKYFGNSNHFVIPATAHEITSLYHIQPGSQAFLHAGKTVTFLTQVG